MTEKRDRMLAIRISEDLYERLSARAAGEFRTVSHLIRLILERGLLEDGAGSKPVRAGATQEAEIERVVLRVLNEQGLLPNAYERPMVKIGGRAIRGDAKIGEAASVPNSRDNAGRKRRA